MTTGAGARAQASPRLVERSAWVAQLRALRDSGWMVFDWLAVVEEPVDGPEAAEKREEPGMPWLRVTVQLLRPAGDPDGFGRIMVATLIAPGAEAPSLTGLWPGAAWHEREGWEMFGLPFSGFADHTGLGLRPLLLDGGARGAPRGAAYDGWPLRKSVLLPARSQTPWPGAVEPGESMLSVASSDGPSDGPSETGGRRGRARGRRRQRPLGVPAPQDDAR